MCLKQFFFTGLFTHTLGRTREGKWVRGWPPEFSCFYSRYEGIISPSSFCLHDKISPGLVAAGPPKSPTSDSHPLFPQAPVSMPLLMHLKGGIPFLFFTCLFSTRLGALWRQGPCTFHLCKESACSAGDLGSIPGSGRSPGEGNHNPLQYS